jgi:hypothetical protein
VADYVDLRVIGRPSRLLRTASTCVGERPSLAMVEQDEVIRRRCPTAPVGTPWRVIATRRRSLGRYGITASRRAIQTGYLPARFAGDLASKIRPGRIGQTEDVADAIVLFDSEQARWITCQKITSTAATQCL